MTGTCPGIETPTFVFLIKIIIGSKLSVFYLLSILGKLFENAETKHLELVVHSVCGMK